MRNTPNSELSLDDSIVDLQVQQKKMRNFFLGLSGLDQSGFDELLEQYGGEKVATALEQALAEPNPNYLIFLQKLIPSVSDLKRQLLEFKDLSNNLVKDKQFRQSYQAKGNINRHIRLLFANTYLAEYAAEWYGELAQPGSSNELKADTPYSYPSGVIKYLKANPELATDMIDYLRSTPSLSEYVRLLEQKAAVLQLDLHNVANQEIASVQVETSDLIDSLLQEKQRILDVQRNAEQKRDALSASSKAHMDAAANIQGELNTADIQGLVTEINQLANRRDQLVHQLNRFVIPGVLHLQAVQEDAGNDVVDNRIAA